jgi:hypothetical protein
MRKFFTSGRRRYALLLLLGGVGSLAIMGASCAPTKQPPPQPTGLSIEPTSWDFGTSTNTPETFTVTNNGPDTSGTLTVATQGNDHDDFTISNDTCTNQVLNVDATCTVDVTFVGTGAANQRLTDLVVSSTEPADGQPDAPLTGTVA